MLKLNPRRKSEIFTREDFDQADNIGKLYLHLMDPDRFEINNAQADHLEKIEKVWAIMSRKMNTLKRVNLIKEVLAVTHRQAYIYIDEATWLFGDILKTNADAELAMLKEKYYQLASKAENDGDFETARKCYESAEKVIQKIQDAMPGKKRVFTEIVFTSNPKALTQAEDAEFEELDDEAGSVLELQAIAIPSGSAAH